MRSSSCGENAVHESDSSHSHVSYSRTRYRPRHWSRAHSESIEVMHLLELRAELARKLALSGLVGLSCAGRNKGILKTDRLVRGPPKRASLYN